MKNISKIFSVVLSLIMFSFVIAGCSNGSDNTSDNSDEQSTTSEATSTSVSSVENTSSEPSEVSYEISSESEIVDGSSSDSSLQDYTYNPERNSYTYVGNEKKVTIPSDFSTCPSFSMENINVEEIILPETVTEIPSGAFYYCKNLKKLTILNPNCTVKDGSDLEFYLTDGLNHIPVDVYFYFNRDKSIPQTSYSENSFIRFAPKGDSELYQSLKGDVWCTIHDLAEEPYE